MPLGGGPARHDLRCCQQGLWLPGSKLPFFKTGNLANGALLMQAPVALRTEPYK